MAQNWAFQSAGTVVTGANPTVPLPATYSTGSLLVIVGANNGGTGSNYTVPSGWTSLLASTANSHLSAFYKFATSSETSVSLTITSNTCVAVMVAYSNISALDVSGTENTGTGTALTTTALTTTTSDDLVLSFFSATNVSSGSLTAGSGYTVRVNYSVIGNTVLLIGDENKAPAGATTSRSATNATSRPWNTFAVSFSQVQTNTGNFFFMFN